MGGPHLRRMEMHNNRRPLRPQSNRGGSLADWPFAGIGLHLGPLRHHMRVQIAAAGHPSTSPAPQVARRLAASRAGVVQSAGAQHHGRLQLQDHDIPLRGVGERRSLDACLGSAPRARSRHAATQKTACDSSCIQLVPQRTPCYTPIDVEDAARLPQSGTVSPGRIRFHAVAFYTTLFPRSPQVCRGRGKSSSRYVGEHLENIELVALFTLACVVLRRRQTAGADGLVVEMIHNTGSMDWNRPVAFNQHMVTPPTSHHRL